ncbi:MULTISPECIES: hypothetical protein [Paraburkholderia]|uniref:Uncharacterized protein n=1 Tax=Paraburkholderia madseniana TaxID=2599607 RepID=A0AAP5EUE5_9BURK|nr:MULTISPECIES: hypothetical protein [Paraburkholderia]MCX4152363.1 hypothetical protein [Paraburkholderia madseniana]MDN7155291.1 hypothetical protein [Paraburkholderia sp. WS6]MDQ6414174.1 hypothetical protein [Paraburkholderia madseniana]
MKHSDAPWGALKRATDQVQALKAQTDPQKQAESWQDLLIQLERVWNKSEAHFSKSPKWTGWKSNYERLRKVDPLLSYLRHARNADEHTAEEITERKPGSWTLNPAIGKSLHIKHMNINKGQIERLETDVPVKFTVIDGAAAPIDVTDRGVAYAVPTEHLGKSIPSPNFVAMAELAVDFYTGTLKAAEEFFVD